MKVLIIGGVAAGTKVAAKLKREDKSIDVTIITKEKDISYAACGLPYYIGNVVQNKEKLVVYTPKAFTALTGAEIITQTEVTSVEPSSKSITTVSLGGSDVKIHTYDKLVIASGASAVVPEIDGADLKNVFTLRTLDDAVLMREAIDGGAIKRALVVGTGFVGLEIAENLHSQGIKVLLLDSEQHVLNNVFDTEFCEHIENKLANEGIMPMTGVSIEAISGEGKVEKVITSKRAVKTDAVVFAVGIRANTEFLADSGILMENGVILTNENLETNIEDIYAVGDCAFVSSRLTGKKTWSPKSSTASIAGRVLAQNIVGNKQEYLGVLETSIAKLASNLSVGRTGLTEAVARAHGFNVEAVTIVADDKANFYPDAGNLSIKLIAEKGEGKILGAQVVGKDNVDKIIDIVVTAISLGARVEQLQNLDFAYAPPFSTAVSPFSKAIDVLINKMNDKIQTVTPSEFKSLNLSEYKVVDINSPSTVEGAEAFTLAEITDDFDSYPKDEKMVLLCNKGRKAFLAQNKLEKLGYENTKVLEGGIVFTDVEL